MKAAEVRGKGVETAPMDSGRVKQKASPESRDGQWEGVWVMDRGTWRDQTMLAGGSRGSELEVRRWCQKTPFLNWGKLTNSRVTVRLGG